MKFSATLALAVIVGLVASSSAFPAQKRVIYYQRPAQYYAAPQRMMYVQYMHSSPFARSTQGAEALVAGESVATGTYMQDCDHAEGEISAAGPAVAFEAPASVDIVAERGEDVLSEAHGVHATQAVSESYPAPGETAFEVPADVDIVAEENEVPDDDAKVPRDFNLDAFDSNNAPSAADSSVSVVDVEAPVEYPAEAPVEVPAEAPVASPVEAPVQTHIEAPVETPIEAPVETPIEAPVETPIEAPVETGVEAGVAADLPVPAPIAPVSSVAKKPLNRYLPAKKKVYVALDQSVESAEDSSLAVASEEADEEEEEEHVAPVTRRPARRPASKKPSKAAAGSKKEQEPLPVGTFFPVHFGGTKGGAIAIANSFSTGKGGSATSHAIAYGYPDAASLRGCVTCKKH